MVPGSGLWAISGVVLAILVVTALTVALGAGGSASRLELARRVARADPDTEALLSAVSAEERGGEWRRLQVLARLAAGADAEAALLAQRLAEENVAAGWSLHAFLEIHSDRATESHFRPPLAREGNPALEVEAELWRWARCRLGEPAAEPVGVVRVDLLGAALFAPGVPADRPPDERRARVRQWLQDGRRELLERLARATSRVEPAPTRDSTSWILVTYLRRNADLDEHAAALVRLSQLLVQPDDPTPPSAALHALWVQESGNTDRPPTPEPADEWRRELDESVFPVILARTNAPENFLAPGFERGDVTLLLDPQRRVRMVIGRAIPLPVLHRRIAALLESGE